MYIHIYVKVNTSIETETRHDVHVWNHGCRKLHAHDNVSACTSTFVDVYMHIYIYMYMHMYTHMHMNVVTCNFMYVFTCICVHLVVCR